MFNYEKYKQLIKKSDKNYTEEELQKIYDSLLHLAELNHKLITDLKK